MKSKFYVMKDVISEDGIPTRDLIKKFKNEHDALAYLEARNNGLYILEKEDDTGRYEYSEQREEWSRI